MILAFPPAHPEFADRLGLPSLPAELLAQALTHRSYLNETDETAASNERLEFLGDAILGMVIATELCERYPDAGEGELTRMRADIVQGATLARVAARNGIGEALVLGRGEEAVGGRARTRNLAGALEALIGAVYQAHGLPVARTFILALLRDELETLERVGSTIDPKSSLQQLAQSRWHQPPEYVTVSEAADGGERRFTVEVRVAGTVLGHGSGASKREAQQAAAREAIDRMAAEPGV